MFYFFFAFFLVDMIAIPIARGNPGPDLTNRSPSYDGVNPTKAVPEGTNITIWCDVLNQGDTASGAFNLSFYASMNAIFLNRAKQYLH